MYKRIQRVTFNSATFAEPIENILLNQNRHFLKSVEYSLWKKYLSVFPEAMGIDDIYDYIQLHLGFQSDEEPLEFDIHPQVVVELLDSILTSKMEEMMLVTDLKEPSDIKPLIPSVTFNEYLELDQQTDILSVLGVVFETHLESYPELERKPLYFILYRLRNNLLYTFDDRIFTTDHIGKTLDKLKKKFDALLLDCVLYNHGGVLSVKIIQSIYKKCETLIIHYFASEQRVGKPLEEGRRIYDYVTELIKNSREFEHLTARYIEIFENLFKNELSESDLRGWISLYLSDFYHIALQFASPTYEKNSLSGRYFEAVRLAIVEAILEQGDPELIIKTEYDALQPEQFKQLFDWMYEENLKIVNYTVCLHVKDLKADSRFSRLDLKDIEFMSDALFEGWQHGLPFQKNFERPHLVRSSEDQQKEYIWVLVHNILAGINDIQSTYQLAEEKLTSCLSLLYFFSARDDDHNFIIEDQYLAYNHDRKKMHHAYASKKGNISAKSIDELDPELVDLLVRFHDTELKWKADILQAAKNFEHYFRSMGISEQMKYLKAVITSLFGNTQDQRSLAAACSVFVSGTNYRGSDVTFIDTRAWLFDDFMEFFMLCETSGKFALKERIMERFKVFCKNVFVTTLVNFDILDSNVHATIKDIVDWLYFVYPNHRPIREEVRDQ